MDNYSQIGVTRLREAYRGLREEVGYFGGTGLMICSFAFLQQKQETQSCQSQTISCVFVPKIRPQLWVQQIWVRLSRFGVFNFW